MPSRENISLAHVEPPVCLDAAYVDRLSGLASAAARRSPDVGNRLLHEIDRATILPSHEMSADVVNIGSKVTFRDEMVERSHTITLVLPQDADINHGKVSVLTPIGVALLGLAKGASISWRRLDGGDRQLTIIQVDAPRSCA